MKKGEIALNKQNQTIQTYEVREQQVTMFSDYPDVVTVEQLMKMLDIGQVLAYKLVKRGEIKSRKVGREYKIPKINVINYLTKG